MKFGKSAEYMKLKRLLAKKTQRQLAKEFNMNSQFVSNWERALCLPPTHILKKMYKSKFIDKQAVEVFAEDFKNAAIKKYERIIR
jgi:transcriptional regulator with XRE-family HTH domain